MSSGEQYSPADDTLSRARLLAQQLCNTYNALPLDDHQRRFLTLQQLMPATKRCQIEPGLRIEYGFNCVIGKGTFINYNATIIDACPVVLGNQVLIGPNTVISTVVGRHTIDTPAASETARPVKVGHRVWLAANVTLCAGVTIGDNAVIGAGSVVTQDVPANALCFGNPARQIRKIAQNTQ
ncbi:sugar O-acetyltransferase [Alteromonas gilva]|uniref:Sugar O-acetyltransferase n=1 Tax=Alteromonas gilva TaxID=2987522 RepID=A0ABT5KY87_9ALTE|nr:sugar O-acetyltransferase [Alteromonas gilva]MDC8829737.1 sugar O-acetyltransferase [Alteromonas gilva]